MGFVQKKKTLLNKDWTDLAAEEVSILSPTSDVWLGAYLDFNSGAGDEAFDEKLAAHEDELSKKYEMAVCQEELGRVQGQLAASRANLKELTDINAALAQNLAEVNSDRDQLKSYNSRQKHYIRDSQESLQATLRIIQETTKSVPALTEEIGALERGPASGIGDEVGAELRHLRYGHSIMF